MRELKTTNTAFVGSCLGPSQPSSLVLSDFTTCSAFSSRPASASCSASLRSRLIRQRVRATSAESSHAPQGIATPTTTQSSSSQKKASLIGLFFLLVTYLWSIVLFIPMLIAHPFVLFRDRAQRRFHDIIAMAWMRCSFGSVGIRPRVINEYNLPPKGTAVVYVANHASFLDVYSFAYLNRRIKYLSKSEIFRLPVVGWAMAMAGNVSIKRMTRRGQMEAYRKMVEVVKNGISLVIYPEGTRSASGKLRRFQSGAFRAAKQQGVPVVPVTILGTRDIMPSHAFVPLRYPRAPITLTVHPPLDSTKHSVEELRDLSFKAIDSALPPELQTRDLPVQNL